MRVPSLYVGPVELLPDHVPRMKRMFHRLIDNPVLNYQQRCAINHSHQVSTPGMARNILSLPVELLHQICAQFCIHCQERNLDCSPALIGHDGKSYYSGLRTAFDKASYSLASLCRTSRLLRQVVEPCLYHAILINEKETRFPSMTTRLVSIVRSIIERYVRDEPFIPKRGTDLLAII